MAHTNGIEPRELAYRAGGGLEVSLVWDPSQDALTVAVSDFRTGEAFELSPAKRRALDAFYHPYAHRCAARTEAGCAKRIRSSS